MSSITSLISAGGGGGTPVNGLVQLYLDGALSYTDESGQIWLKTGNIIASDPATYPDATITLAPATPLFVTSFSVSAQENQPTGIRFNNDGTKMFVSGQDVGSIDEYALSTAFSVSTASFTQVFSVSSQEIYPGGLSFNNDGTKMFVVGQSTDTVYEYSLLTGFDLSTASYSGVSFSVSSQESTPQDITFNTDGTKMFIVGSSGDEVNEYSLGTAFDISTASFTQLFSVSAQDLNPHGIVFNNDGTRMFIVGLSGVDINQYALATGFNISTASFVTNFSVSAQEASPTGIAFNNDGTKMFITGYSGDEVNEYSMIDAFNFGQANIMGLNVDTGTYDYIKLK